MGRLRSQRFRLAGARRPLATHIVQQKLPGRCTGEPHEWYAQDGGRAGRAALFDRSDHSQAHPGGGDRAGDLPRSRAQFGLVYRSGPQPPPQCSHRRMERCCGQVHYGPRAPARSVQPVQGCDDVPRFRSGGARRRLRARGFICRRNGPADLFRSVRRFPEQLRRQPHSEA